MSHLEIHIPDNWPPSEETSVCEATLDWRLRGEQGKVLRTGHGSMSSMPAADQYVIILPASRVLLTSITPPKQNRKKFMQALPYAVEDRIMADPESIHVAPGDVQANGEMPVAIIDREWLRAILDSLRVSGFKPRHAMVETLLAPFTAESWSLIWRGDRGFVRQGLFSGISLDGGDTEHPPAALLLALAGENLKPGSLQIFLEGASLPNLEAWSSASGVSVTAGGEWLRTDSAGSGINLLQGEFAPRATHAEWLPRLRPVFMLAGLILALQVAFTLGDWAMLKYEKHRLTQSMEKHFRKAFPDAKVIVDAPLQMRRNLAELRRSAGIMDQNDFLPLLASIAPALSSGVHLLGLEYQQERIKIRLVLTNPADLESLRARLPRHANLDVGNGTSAGLEVELTIGKQA